MEGRSHLLIGLTAGVILDSVVHLTGDPLTMAKVIPLTLIVKKAVYYFMVGFGALLPDIDNARSTLGHKLGWISKQIQHLAGHRTLFHSLLGLLLGSLIALGLEQLVSYFVNSTGFCHSRSICAWFSFSVYRGFIWLHYAYRGGCDDGGRRAIALAQPQAFWLSTQSALAFSYGYLA